jgi:hypothetical protein
MLLHHVTLHVVFPVVKLAAVLAGEGLQLHVNTLPVSLEVALTLRQTADKLGGTGSAHTILKSRERFNWE